MRRLAIAQIHATLALAAAAAGGEQGWGDVLTRDNTSTTGAAPAEAHLHDSTSLYGNYPDPASHPLAGLPHIRPLPVR